MGGCFTTPSVLQYDFWKDYTLREYSDFSQKRAHLIHRMDSDWASEMLESCKAIDQEKVISVQLAVTLLPLHIEDGLFQLSDLVQFLLSKCEEIPRRPKQFQKGDLSIFKNKLYF